MGGGCERERHGHRPQTRVMSLVLAGVGSEAAVRGGLDHAARAHAACFGRRRRPVTFSPAFSHPARPLLSFPGRPWLPDGARKDHGPALSAQPGQVREGRARETKRVAMPPSPTPSRLSTSIIPPPPPTPPRPPSPSRDYAIACCNEAAQASAARRGRVPTLALARPAMTDDSWPRMWAKHLQWRAWGVDRLGGGTGVRPV